MFYEQETKDIAKGVIIILLILVVMGLVGSGDYQEAVLLQKEYCANLAVWDASGGEDGWPPYQGREVCS
jgi:hypothetical protein